MIGMPRFYYTPLPARDSARKPFIAFIRRHWQPQGTILDIGSAAGHMLRSVPSSPHKTRLISLDHNCELLRFCPQNVSAIAADFNFPLPLKTSSIDAVIASFSLHLARDQDALISELAQCLRPGGNLFILTCSEANLCSRFLNRFLPRLKEKDWPRYRGISHIKRAFKNNNIDLQAIENIRLGSVTIDTQYIETFQARTWSSSLQFSKEEMSNCAKDLGILASNLSINKRELRIPWTRTAVFARKHGRQRLRDNE
jgi:SAM-dependent methyltransferase